MTTMTAIWLEGVQRPDEDELRGGAVFNDGEFSVSVREVWRCRTEYKVSAPGFFLEFSEANYVWDDVSSPDWYIDQVYHSICTHLGAEAWDAIHEAPETMFDVACAAWHESHKAEEGAV